MKHKQRFVESFFDSWSPNMAYVLGYFSADGSMYKNPRGGCYISFTSSDLILVQNIKKILKVASNIEVYRPKNTHWKIRYTLQVGSKIVFDKLLKLGLTPKKSLSLVLPPVPDTVLSHFIRGYFDGDGHTYYGISKRSDRKGSVKHLQLGLRCGSKNFLNDLRTKISQIYKIGHGSLSYSSRAFTLAYSGEDVVKLYHFVYPSEGVLCLERKRNKLKEGIEERGLKCNGFARFPVTE